jgi:hypothetical protein
MRNILKIFVVFVASLTMAGCYAPALHPFFTKENIVFNETLLGGWIKDSGEKCFFTKSGENHYELLYVSDATARFEARLIELDGVTFLDLYPKPMNEVNGLLLANIVPTHTIARVTISKDSISIALMNGDWLKQLSDQNQLDLAHERLDDEIILLTASTRELQVFALKHANTKEAFGEAWVFHHIRQGE